MVSRPSKETLRRALEAYRAGRSTEAETLATRLSSSEPEHEGALYLLGVIRSDAGDLQEARDYLRRAVDSAPGRATFHITLGNVELARNDPDAAIPCFRAAIAIDPRFAPAYANLGTALKQNGQIVEAVAAFRTALRRLRASEWFAPSELGTFDASQNTTFEAASRAKLEHDLEQFRYLQDRSLLPADFSAQMDGYEAVLAEFGRHDRPSEPRALTPQEKARIGRSFNRLVYLPADEPTPAQVLGEGFDDAEIEARYRTDSSPIVVIDDFLSHDALQAVRRFCLEATVWFDCKVAGGYLGAYWNEGFDHPVLFQLERELRLRLPNILRGNALSQMWAFKYATEGFGTRKHADQAAVNVNFWITPDSACRDAERSGLRVYPVSAPPDWNFDRYNRAEDELDSLVARAGVRPIEIPYRCNRCVLFDSSLVHESGELRFRAGYENRRTNVTMLFGGREEEANAR